MASDQRCNLFGKNRIFSPRHYAFFRPLRITGLADSASASIFFLRGLDGWAVFAFGFGAAFSGTVSGGVEMILDGGGVVIAVGGCTMTLPGGFTITCDGG